MRTALVLALLLGCGSTPKPAPDSPQPATASLVDCDQVSEHVAMTAQSTAKLRSGATFDAIKDMVSTRCSTDAWSDEAKRCMFAIKTIQEGRDCRAKLTDAQRTAIKAQAQTLRKDSAGPVDTDDHSDDWIKHVVEEPAPAAAPTKPTAPAPTS